jgi:Ni,Fe-hydrogenase maturation factor
LIILIDAREAEPVGEIFTQKFQPSQNLPQPFSHYLDPAELLSVCQILYGALPEMILTGINTNSFEVSAPVSAAVRANLPKLMDQVDAVLRNALGE